MSMIYTNKNLNGNDLLQVGKVEILSDASSQSDAVRKSQVESIAATAVQTGIVSALANASGTTTYSSEFIQAGLDSKQDVLSVDSQYFTLVGNTLGFKDLGIVKPYKDTSNTTLAEFIADATFNGDGTLTIGGEVLDKMSMIFLQSATDPSEKAFVYMGTNAGTSDDFVSFSVDYNQGTIRSFFSGTGVGMTYTAGTGTYSLDFGNSTSQLGAHSVPVNANEFNNIVPSTVLQALTQLEELVEAVDVAASGGQATISTRLDNLSGVTGANLTTFTQGLFSDNKTIKEILQESESLHKSAIQDRAALRSEAVTEAARVDAAILTEKTRAEGAEATLQANITSEAVSRASGDATQQANLLAEAMTRSSEDTAIKGRLDVLEGSGTGSVAKAEVDAKAHADTIVATEQARALAAEASLGTKIDNLAEGDVQFVGVIGASGVVTIRQARIDAGDTRNGADITSMTVEAGETFVTGVAQTVAFSDEDAVLQVGDKLMAVDDGVATKAKFNITQSDGSAITVASVDGARIELSEGKLDVTADSIDRTQLAATVEADIDDKRSLTVANAITSDGDTHFVSSTATGAQQNIYVKREQTSSDALTGTARAILAELHVNSDGSGSAVAPSYAHTTTMATHYTGDCVDLSMVIAGGNFEGNGKANTATQATGVYGTATKSQLGVNVGGTFVADGAAVSNLGAFGFASTDGVGADRGVYGAVAAMDVATFSGTRTADPVPHNDVAVVADAKYAPAGSKALYAYGDVVLEGGSVTVPSASSDTDAVNLGDIKGKERIFEFDLSDGVAKTITISGINLDRAIMQTTDNNETVEVKVVRDSVNSQVVVTATGGNLTDVRLLVQELSCSVTQA